MIIRKAVRDLRVNDRVACSGHPAITKLWPQSPSIANHGLGSVTVELNNGKTFIYAANERIGVVEGEE